MRRNTFEHFGTGNLGASAGVCFGVAAAADGGGVFHELRVCIPPQFDIGRPLSLAERLDVASSALVSGVVNFQWSRNQATLAFRPNLGLTRRCPGCGSMFLAPSH